VYKRMTISIREDVHEALMRVIGRGKVSKFLEGLAKPIVLKNDLLTDYKNMAEDAQREEEALIWAEELTKDENLETR
jgi:hypothetical protein